jgi:hypothetical protein
LESIRFHGWDQRTDFRQGTRRDTTLNHCFSFFRVLIVNVFTSTSKTLEVRPVAMPLLSDAAMSLQSDAGDDDSSVVSVSSATGSRATGTDTDNGSEKDQLSRKESRDVFLLRVVVILVMLLAATAVSVIVFFITRNSETAEFETQFGGAAEQVTIAFEAIVGEKLGAISALALAAIAHGVDHFREWPFVTLSSFQQRSLTARSLSKVLYVSIAPVVTDANKAEWEEFVVGEDATWIQEGYAYQEDVGLDAFHGAETTATSTDPGPIFFMNERGEPVVASGAGPYLPHWEMSPLLSKNMVNLDVLANPVSAPKARLCLETQSVVIGALEAAPPGDASSDASSSTAFYSTLLSIAARENVSYKGDPMTTAFIPIFDSFGDDRRAIGVMKAVMNWASYFKDLLPPTIRGVVIVLKNPCYDSYTYKINGREVIPIGVGVSKLDGTVTTNTLSVSHAPSSNNRINTTARTTISRER